VAAAAKVLGKVFTIVECFYLVELDLYATVGAAKVLQLHLFETLELGRIV
jgi:hypothetical protein